MRKIISKIAGLMLGLSLAAGVGVAVGARKAEGVRAAGGTFNKITSIGDLTSGANYLIVSEEDNLAFDGSLTTIDAVSNTQAITVSSNSITTSADFYFTITSKTGGYSIKGSGGYYIGSTSANANEMKNGTSDSYTNTITWDSDNSCFIIRGTNSYLVYNGTSGQTRFRYFKPATCNNGVGTGAYHKVSLFKEFTGGECTHNWVAGTVHNPTCTEAGYTEYECSECGQTKQDNVTAALGHNYGEIIVDTAATCTEDGAGHKVCSRDSSHVENVVIPATGHNFVSGVCTVCGAEEPDETTVSLDFSSNAYGITSTQGNQTLTGDGATYGFEFNIGTATGTAGAKANSGYILFGKTGVYFRNTSAPANSYISAISWSYPGTVSGNVQLSLSYGSEALTTESSPITSFGKASANGVVSLTQTDTNMSYFFIYVTNAYNCQWNSFSVTWASKGGDTPGSTYSVTYNKNESASRPVENMPTNVSGLEDGETCTLTGSPTRWGYTFLGWGASSSATETISSVTIDGADETVYALWQEDHTVAGAWSDSPYTVAQARTAIDNNTHLTDVYVSGIISQVDSYNSTYKSITYWISDDGTTTNQFEVYSGKGLNGADFSAVGDVEVGAEVVVNGDIKKYNSTYEFDKTSKQISYVGPSTGDIDVTFTPSLFLGVGDSGTYVASTEATNPSYSFSSGDSSVLSVASNGAYSAVAAGTTTVRVDVTSSDGNGYKEVTVTVCAVKTVSQAYDIAAALSSGATTDYSIKVTGAISSLDADGKGRAINFTDGAQVIEVFFGGGNADYTTVTSSGYIGSKVTVFAKVQNYSGTYELKDITLAGVATGDADSYAAGAYKSLDESCTTGPDAVTQDQWTAVSNGYSQLSLADQAKFRDSDLTPHGENVVNWVDRYSRIVSNTELTNFMSLSNISGSRYAFSTNEASKSSTIVIVVVALTSITSIGVLLVIKRKRSLVK